AVRSMLKGLDQVTLEGVDPRGQGLLAVHLRTRGDAREALSRACSQAGLGLLELRSEHHGLEELFVELLGHSEVA
ncbi:MAG: hypothetical protein OEW39_15125, partial [Deltaproteobacteria bacterium]|nr:hypothetical protein [Deltaproteobacteria bacterium]